jgi:hypothetical protein
MDTKLLAVFDEVYKTRSVSRAGDNLGMPQTSVSLALGRLRRQFNEQQTPKLLESGDSDLAVGFMPELEAASTSRSCSIRASLA